MKAQKNQSAAQKALVANEGYTGKCKVLINYCYSLTQIDRPKDRYAYDENGGEAIFENYEAAKNWVDGMYKGVYYLSYGEMGRPTYVIMQA